MINAAFKKNYMIWAALIVVAIFIILALFLRKPEKAQAVGLLPFGGHVTSVIYCCNGLDISVGPPRGGTFMLYWTTFAAGVYSNYNVYVPDGQDVLGDASTVGSCVTIGSACESATPTSYSIVQIGSSL